MRGVAPNAGSSPPIFEMSSSFARGFRSRDHGMVKGDPANAMDDERALYDDA